ncbi:histone H4-like [Chrysoperla carnea]|uniref:histone H4-like n=1 Tax=Chrysoperla carnea TaxID=189513 RepID=UPI001D090A17|nr:histone H4-like [Chrysoperla carnea]
MTGRGQGEQANGNRRVVQRQRRVLRDPIQGIRKPAIRRLARRAGIKRISGLVYEETRGLMKVFLENVIGDAVKYTEHGKRKTVTDMDVVHALKRQGFILYGFGRV